MMDGEKLLAQHFDMKRAMWKRDYMDTVVERLKEWGFNALIYEIEDKLPFTKHPAVADPRSPSQKETASFVRACRLKSIEVIPLMQSLGHAECVLAKPEYAHLRETPEIEDQYNPLSVEARSLILELYEEIIDVFGPQTYFHMGGDETWHLGKSGMCASAVKEIGIGGLYLQHMAPIFEYIHKKGLRPIIWADILLSYPEMVGKLPGYVIPMDWDYWTYQERPLSILAWGEGNPTLSWNDYPQKAPRGFEDFFERYAVDNQTHRDGSFRSFFYTDALEDRGFEVLTAPASRCAGDMYGVGHLAMHMPNCFYFTRKGLETGAGTLVTSWAVRHTHPEICQLASYAASLAVDPQRSYAFDEIADAYTETYYGEKFRSFATAVEMAERQFAPGLVRVPKLDFRLSASKSRKDPIAGYIELMDEIHRGRDAAVEYLKNLIAGYMEAREIFADLKKRAHKNSQNLDFWIEAADVDAVQAETLLAAMEGEIESKADGLLKKIDGLKASAGNLFATTYEEWSIEDELQIRYGYQEQYLRSIRV